MTSAAPNEFLDAVTRLSALASDDKPLSGNFGVAIAVLLHRMGTSRPILSPVGGPAVSNAEFQAVCNDTWRKRDDYLPPTRQGPILKPFELSFKPELGNNWRHSFAAQGGLGCHAPEERLVDQEFLDRPRVLCEFRNPHSGLCGVADFPSTCFNPSKGGALPGPGSRAVDRPKFLVQLQVTPRQAAYTYVEPSVPVLRRLLGRSRAAVSAEDFATVLFSGSDYWSDGGSVRRLRAELALPDELFSVLFSDRAMSVSADANRGAILLDDPVAAAQVETGQKPANGAGAREEAPPTQGLPAPTDFQPRSVSMALDSIEPPADPRETARLLAEAVVGHQECLNSLAAFLEAHGFRLDQQSGGYDLRGRRGQTSMLCEVKTWTAANLASQVRSGWAQLHEYAYRNRALMPDGPIHLVLALDRRPPATFWAWEWFAELGAPIIIWRDGAEFRTLDVFESVWLDLLNAA